MIPIVNTAVANIAAGQAMQQLHGGLLLVALVCLAVRGHAGAVAGREREQMTTMTTTPAFPAAMVQVQWRTVTLQPKLVVHVGLSCGHEQAITLSEFPVLAVTETLGWPEVGDEWPCTECEPPHTPDTSKQYWSEPVDWHGPGVAK